MNSTEEAKSEQKSSNVEFYLLIVVIKLTFLIATKVIQMLTKIYNFHNTRVIESHVKTFNEFNKSQITKPQPKPRAGQNDHHDIEAGSAH